MYERFTDEARHVTLLAQDEARDLQHDSIGAEHVLLGLLREDEGLAARVLNSFGITADEARSEVARIAGKGDTVIRGSIPFTPQVKNVLVTALRESLSRRHKYIGTEHLLLGLLRETEGAVVTILRDLDADREEIRAEVIRVLAAE